MPAIVITPEEAELAVQGIIALQKAVQSFMTKSLPVLQKGSGIIGSMADQNRELPNAEERASLKTFASMLDKLADEAIESAS